MHKKRLVTDCGFRTEHGVSKAQGLTLPDVDASNPLRNDALNGLEQLLLAGNLKGSLELRVCIEVIGDRALRRSRDEDQLCRPGRDSLLDCVLNERLVDDRQHFFWTRLRCRKKTCAAPGDGKNSCSDL